MLTVPRRGGVQRLCLFSAASLASLDLSWADLGAFSEGAQEEDAVPVASGTERPGRRRAPFAVEITRSGLADAWDRMRSQRCPVYAVALGWPSEKGGHHVAHLDPSAPLGAAPGVLPFGELAGTVARLVSTRFHAARWSGPDLLAGVPWRAEAAVAVDGETVTAPPWLVTGGAYAVLPGPDGYAGPQWVAPYGTSVAADGSVTTSGTLKLAVPCPFPGARLQLEVEGSLTGGAIGVYDRSGARVGSAAVGLAFTLPAGAWTLEISLVGTITAPPELWVVDAGRALGFTPGTGQRCGGLAEAPAVVDLPPVDNFALACVGADLVATWDAVTVENGTLLGYKISVGTVTAGIANTAGPPFERSVEVLLADLADPANPSFVIDTAAMGLAAGVQYGGSVQAIVRP